MKKIIKNLIFMAIWLNMIFIPAINVDSKISWIIAINCIFIWLPIMIYNFIQILKKLDNEKTN